MKNLTVSEAKETIIYVIENGKPEEITLYSHIMASVDETTTPRGVAPRCFVEELTDDNDESYWTISTWGIGGNNYRQGTEIFESEEDAEDELFNRVWQYDFYNDCNRNTEYFDSYDKANERLAEMYAEAHGIDNEVAASILRKKDLVNETRKKIAEEFYNKERERINIEAMKYAELIPTIEGESHIQTRERMSNAIGHKIEGSIFFKAVSIVRHKQVK